ncbi:hypothetical protein PBCVCviKI_608R [Paramecium bursaria Chlorella virus CviKI]|nr:hypothetical protein PBCVCviKI_608R [Paramecium bursaria Chlorella virus CviKI]
MYLDGSVNGRSTMVVFTELDIFGIVTKV